MASKPTQIEAGPTLLEVKSPIPGKMEKALRHVMPQPMADFVFGAVVYELQTGDMPKGKPPTRGHTYGGGENITRALTSPMQDTYPDDEFGFPTIDLMLKTGAVRFALELKKAAVLSALFNELQWQVECEDEKLRRVVEADMKRVFATYGAEMLSMLEYGAFFGELIWEYVPATMRGLEDKGKWWVLEGINAVKPETVDHINRVKEGKNKGRFDGFVQAADSPWPEHAVPADQALILTSRKKWRNLWGESILKAAYPLWYWFDIVLAAFIRYLGRSGVPLTKATAPMKGRMKMSDGKWMSTMDYALLVATEATRSEAIALPSDRNPETNESLFTLEYVTDDKRGDQFIGALKFLSDLLTRSIIMGAMADISKEGGGFNKEEMRWGMTQLDNQQILSMMVSQLARYHLPKYATYNASTQTYIDMRLVGLDPDRIDRVFKFLSTAGNQKEGDALNWPNWELIFQLSGVPTISKEEVDKLKKEREQKALDMQKMMKEKKAEEEGPPPEDKEKEKAARKEELEEVLWKVLVDGSPILLSANQLEEIARDNPDLFQEQTTIELFNPYHDEKGRFAAKAGAATISGVDEWRKDRKARMETEFKYRIGVSLDKKTFENRVNGQRKQLVKRLPGCETPPRVRMTDASVRYAGAHTDNTIHLPYKTMLRIINEEDGGIGHHIFLHESVHARKRPKRPKPGSWQEEGSTELIARKLYKDIYGQDSGLTAYNFYVERMGRVAWKASNGNPKKAWQYVDDVHTGKVKLRGWKGMVGGQGWEAMLGAKYKFEEGDDLEKQLLDLIEADKWEEAKAFVEEHQDDEALVFMFGELWIAKFGIEEKEE